MDFYLTIYACGFGIGMAYLVPKKFIIKLRHYFAAALLLSIIISCIRVTRVAFMPPSREPAYILVAWLIKYGSVIWFFQAVFNMLFFKRWVKYHDAEAIGIRTDYLKIINWGYNSAAIFNGALFLFYTIGKIKHWHEMEAFFIDSGYPRYFTYLSVLLECIMSLLLLIPVHNSIQKYAAFILLLEMFGAVATHIRNGDPLVASHDALMQIIVIILLLFWCVAKGKAIRVRD